MTLKTLFVLGHTVKVKGAQGLILPYQFQAVETIKFNTNDQDDVKAAYYNATDIFVVDIVMPIGGSESALFRYPKEGEKVLVGEEQGTYYLMGYVPVRKVGDKIEGLDDIFTGKNNEQILPEDMAGQFFRYKGPNDSTEDKKTYSEIGFYTEKTKWRRQGEESPPEVDTLRIKSTGDIHQESANYSRIKAQRFELLSDCDSDFGDHSGDNSFSLKGDVNIRAKNRVVIKAGGSIVLKAGRSSIVINDNGITLLSRKVDTNIPNSWDSTINIDVHNGIKIGGQRIINQAGIEFIVWDSHGGTINSKIGVVRIAGIDVALNKFTTKEYLEHGIISAAEFAANVVKTGAAFIDEYAYPFSKGIVDNINMVDGIFAALMTGAHVMLPKMTGAATSFNPPGWFSGLILKAVDISKLILMISRIVAGMLIPEKIKREKPAINDILYAAFAVVEYGLMTTAWGVLSVAWAPYYINNSIIQLSDSDIFMESMNIYNSSVMKMDLNTPTAGLNVDISAAMSKIKKILAVVLGVAGAAALAGVISTFMLVSKPANEKFAKELMSL